MEFEDEELNKLLNKKPGEYSEEELYKIGLAHKSMPRGKRNWELLAKETGYVSPGNSGNGDAYRCWVKRLQLKDGTLEKNKALLSARNIDDASADEMSESIQNQIDDLYKTKALNRDILNEHRRLLRDDARLERLKESVREAVKMLPKMDLVPSADGADPNEEAILMVSDLHIGMTIDSFSNKYNFSIAEKRVAKLTEDTIKYCRMNNVRRLNVVNLGDLISGIIHITIRLQEEFDAIEQTMKAAELISNMLNRLQEAAPEVIYSSCTDNHSRLVADKNQAIEKENLYRIMDWFIEERLKGTNVKFGHDNLSPVLGKFKLINGKVVMFSHGHLNRPNMAFQDFIGASEEYIHYVLLGHYHCEKTKYFQNMKVFINGSICGTDPYAEGLMKFTKPSQTLIVLDGDNVANYSINLSNC